MELNEWAHRIFAADTLEEKLLAPAGGLKDLTDRSPGPAVAWKSPPRPAHLQVADRKKRVKFPSPEALAKEEMRARCLHTFANHELMALEMMAWALLAFPEAPSSFRKGLANILLDEQRHFALYSERLNKMGIQFGDLPVNDHFWRVAAKICDPLDWVCTMHLTFEQANLDHAPFYAARFREVEDLASAELMDLIFHDEIRHVRFGSRWLRHYQPQDRSMFEVFQEHCTVYNSPSRARGPEFQEQARLEAGLDADFVRALQNWEPS